MNRHQGLLALSAMALIASTSTQALAQAAPPATAPAAAAAALTLDDGYLWFEAENVETSVAGRRVDQGYYVKAWVRAWGAMPRNSAFVLNFSQGGRQLARVRCSNDTPGFERDPTFAFTHANECYDQTALLQVTGDVQVELRAVNGSTDAETVLGTRTINVQRIAQTEGGMNPRALPDHYFVSHHGRALDSVLYWHSFNDNDSNAWSYVDQGLGGSLMGMLFTFNANDTQASRVLADASVRCQVNGQPFEPTGSPLDANTRTQYYTNRTRTYLPPGSPGGTAQQAYRFQMLSLQMPFRSTHLRANPGRWTCDLRSGGRTLRRWAWTVGPDGVPVPHAEQAAGLHLGPRAILAETTIPADGGLDERTNPPEVVRGGFYGRPWASELARTQAAAVPAVGQPFMPYEPFRAGGGSAASSGGASRGRPRRR